MKGFFIILLTIVIVLAYKLLCRKLRIYCGIFTHSYPAHIFLLSGNIWKSSSVWWVCCHQNLFLLQFVLQEDMHNKTRVEGSHRGKYCSITELSSHNQVCFSNGFVDGCYYAWATWGSHHWDLLFIVIYSTCCCSVWIIQAPNHSRAYSCYTIMQGWCGPVVARGLKGPRVKRGKNGWRGG